MFSNIQTGTLWWKHWQFCYIIRYDFRVKNVQAEKLDIRFKISTVPSLPQIILPPFHSKSKNIWLAMAIIILTTTGRTCILNICLIRRLAWGNNVPKYSTIHQNYPAKPLTTVYPYMVFKLCFYSTASELFVNSLFIKCSENDLFMFALVLLVWCYYIRYVWYRVAVENFSAQRTSSASSWNNITKAWGSGENYIFELADSGLGFEQK